MGTKAASNLDTWLPIQLIVGLVLVGIGVGVAFETGTGAGSVSALGIGLGGTFGFVAGVADRVDPLRRAFERGQTAITGAAILFLWTAVMNYYTLALLVGLTIGLGVGTVVATVTVRTVRDR